MFEGLRPWLNRVPGRLMHTTILGCGIFGSVSGSFRRHLRDHQQGRVARTGQARL